MKLDITIALFVVKAAPTPLTLYTEHIIIHVCIYALAQSVCYDY